MRVLADEQYYYGGLMAGESGNQNVCTGDQGVNELDGWAKVSLALETGDYEVVDSEQLRQRRQDQSVEVALWHKVGVHLHGRDDLQVHLVENPTVLGVSLEQLAQIEMAAYENAGYGDRAEGYAHFERMFRGYKEYEHGPPRFVLVAEWSRNERGVVQPRALVFGDYFEIGDGFAKLDPDVAAAAADWRARHPGLHPGEFIGSKYVTDPEGTMPSVGLIGPAALALAGTLRGIADANPNGIMIAARTQPDSQKLIRLILPRLVSGIEILCDRLVPSDRGGPPQAMMLAYVPPQPPER